MFIASLLDEKKSRRWKVVFDEIFKSYQYNDSNLLKNKKNKYLILDKIWFDFLTLVMNSFGKFEIFHTKLYLLSDSRFFMRIKYLEVEELNNLINIINENKLNLDPRFNNTTVFKTKSVDFDLGVGLKLNIIRAFINYICKNIESLWIKDCKDIYIYQLKLFLCKQLHYVCILIEKQYNLSIPKTRLINCRNEIVNDWNSVLNQSKIPPTPTVSSQDESELVGLGYECPDNIF